MEPGSSSNYRRKYQFRIWNALDAKRRAGRSIEADRVGIFRLHPVSGFAEDQIPLKMTVLVVAELVQIEPLSAGIEQS